MFCDPHKGFGIINKAEVDVFLELSSLFYDSVDVGNFSKSSLNISKFSVHVLLKPSLLGFTHITLLVCELSAIV